MDPSPAIFEVQKGGVLKNTDLAVIIASQTRICNQTTKHSETARVLCDESHADSSF